MKPQGTWRPSGPATLAASTISRLDSLLYPGAKDQSARDRCYSFAKSHGCTVHDEINQLFRFIREA